MKLNDIKTLVKSLPIVLAVVLYLIFKPDAAATADVKMDHAVTQTGNELHEVTYIDVSDGDTINVDMNGQKERVRLLMIDTPEMNYKEKKPQPYAEEAKQFTEQLLSEAETVHLLYDVGEQTDQYDRLLAYVFVDGVSLQEHLLKEGYAAVRYVNAPNNTFEKQFYSIEKQAKQAKVNIWSKDGYFDAKVGFQEDVMN
ncbi:MAG: thermonuclease family protein [Caryophanon sp.]|nr:thermonuclease family protein [Caryophanon sp.]